MIGGSLCCSLFSFPLLQKADLLLHLLTWLERHDVFFGNIDPLAGSRIAGLSSRSLLHLEHAEVPKLNPMLAHKCVDNCIEGLLDNFFRLQLGHPNLFRNCLHNIFFRHN